MDFRHILKWKSCYSLVFHAIPLISTDLKFKNRNSTPYMYVLIMETLYRKITSMLPSFIHLKHAAFRWNKNVCCLHSSFQKHKVLGRLEVSTAVALRILVFWDVTVYCWVHVSSNISKEHTALTQGTVSCVRRHESYELLSKSEN